MHQLEVTVSVSETWKSNKHFLNSLNLRSTAKIMALGLENHLKESTNRDFRGWIYSLRSGYLRNHKSKSVILSNCNVITINMAHKPVSLSPIVVAWGTRGCNFNSLVKQLHGSLHISFLSLLHTICFILFGLFDRFRELLNWKQRGLRWKLPQKRLI